MTWTRAALALALAVAAGLALVSGGSSADPRTPPALPGLPPPFLGTAVAGGGAMTAAVDAYGDVVDLRPSPAGRALIDNPSDRQAAGSVPADTGIVPRLRIDGGPALAPWEAGSARQRYLRGTNVVRTELRFGPVRERVTTAAVGDALVVVVAVTAASARSAEPSIGVNLGDASGLHCRSARAHSEAVLVCAGPAGGSAIPRPALGSVAARLIRRAAGADRAWLRHARLLGSAAPAWARRMYARSLLTLRALTDSRTGAVAAGARDGWAYVWPRDAGTAALALAASGYEPEARRAARFLSRLDLGAAARFEGDGEAVPGRGAQGDAAGWATVAAEAAGLPNTTVRRLSRNAGGWRNRPDYQEGSPGDYLANAIASTAFGRSAGAGIGAGEFESRRGLERRAGDPASGLDSAAAWAVRPFAIPALQPAARATLLRLAGRQTRFGITPGETWPGADPWSAPTAWSAWAFAALSRGPAGAEAQAAVDRRQALRLLGDLRRAATPAGALPERVAARSGIPRSTTPLAWSHAFAILALRELWPGRSGSGVRYER